jgi:hypothetical protein
MAAAFKNTTRSAKKIARLEKYKSLFFCKKQRILPLLVMGTLFGRRRRLGFSHGVIRFSARS